MFYKKENNGWLIGSVVKIPIDSSGDNLSVIGSIILDENNKQSYDGWEWHDEPPQDYIDWVSSQEEFFNSK